jgi:hypothetical protein
MPLPPELELAGALEVELATPLAVELATALVLATEEFADVLARELLAFVPPAPTIIPADWVALDAPPPRPPVPSTSKSTFPPHPAAHAATPTKNAPYNKPRQSWSITPV